MTVIMLAFKKNIYVRMENGNLVAALGDFGTAKLEEPNIFAIARTTARNTMAWTPPEYLSSGGGCRLFEADDRGRYMVFGMHHS